MRVNICVSELITTGMAIANVGFGILGWGLIGGTIVASSASLLGLLGGVLYQMVHGELGNIGRIILYFAFSGATAGALLGVFFRLVDAEGAADLAQHSPLKTKKADTLTPSPLNNPLLVRWRPLERTGTCGDPRLNNPSLN